MVPGQPERLGTMHGKEGVRGSSPREGFTNPLLTTFLVVR